MKLFEEILKEFKEKQEKILELHKKLKEAESAAQKEIDDLMALKKQAIEPLALEFNKARETYKAEMKAAFGICDGEPMNILETIEALRNALLMQ